MGAGGWQGGATQQHAATSNSRFAQAGDEAVVHNRDVDGRCRQALNHQAAVRVAQHKHSLPRERKRQTQRQLSWSPRAQISPCQATRASQNARTAPWGRPSPKSEPASSKGPSNECWPSNKSASTNQLTISAPWAGEVRTTAGGALAYAAEAGRSKCVTACPHHQSDRVSPADIRQNASTAHREARPAEAGRCRSPQRTPSAPPECTSLRAEQLG